jgi:hypothetical protein
MPVKAGQIVIDISAGTSKFVTDIEAAKGKIREFGREAHGSVSGIQAVSANLRVMEGNMTNNLRAAERFLAMLPGVANAAKLAFPVAGAIAFGGIVYELGTKVYDFFKKLQEGPEKSATAWSKLAGSVHATTAELELTGAKLDQDIARLSGKPENGLAVAIAEANVAANKLGETLDANLAKIYETFKQQEPGFWDQLLGAISNKKVMESLGGLTGGGALVAESRANTAARNALGPSFDKQYYEAQLATAQSARQPLADDLARLTKLGAHIQQFLGTDSADYRNNQKALENAQKQVDIADQTIAQLKLEIANTGKTVLKDKLEAAKRNGDGGLSELENYERSIREKGLTELGKIYARRDDLGFAPGSAFGNRAAVAANTEADRYLSGEETKGRDETEKIFGYDNEYGQHIPGSAEMELRKRQEADNKELDSVLKTWADGVVKSFKTNFEQIKKAKEEAFRVGNISAERAAEAGIEGNTEQKLRIEAQYASQRSHSYQDEVNYLGQISALDTDNLKLKLQAAEAELANAKTLGDEERIEEKALEVDKARVALKKQELEVDVQRARLDSQHLTTLQSGYQQFFADLKAKAKEPGQILYDGMSSALDRVSGQLAKFATGQKTSWGKTFQGIGEQMVQESTKAMLSKGLGKLGDLFGIHAPKGKPDGTAGNPYHVIVDGQGPAAQNAVPGGGLGALGGLFGSGSLGGGIFSLFGGLGSLFSSGGEAAAGGASAGIESVTSAISFPMLASGGDVDPGRSYIVGDGGEPELFRPKTAGTVIPFSKMGGGSHTYIIDARGAEVGVEHRVARAIHEAHSSAISGSVQAHAENRKRMPQHASK